MDLDIIICVVMIVLVSACHRLTAAVIALQNTVPSGFLR
jgi:hypothetical protein